MTAPAAGTLRQGALQVVQQLQQAGFTAYWAGGCVRDELLGRVPRDYDIATDAVPEAVQSVFPAARAIGKAFGVMQVRALDQDYEVATFRHDHSYRDGRHPETVTFSTPEEDALRRDFTINAMFYDPLQDRVIDRTGGRQDLARRCLRCVGHPVARFQEDHLRILRAIRLAATLEFSIAPETATAIRDSAPLLQHISAERIRQELTRTLMEAPRPGDALRQMHDLGVLAAILPEVAAMHGQEQPPEYHPEGDVLQHTILMLNSLRERSETLVYAVLLHDVGKPPTAAHDGQRIRFNRHDVVGAAIAESLLARLRLPRRTIETVHQVIRLHMQFAHVHQMRPSTLRRMLGRETFPLELELHRLDCLSSHRKLEHYDFLLKQRENLQNEPALPRPWLSGRDVLAAGIPEGPGVGDWLRRAYDRQLEGADPGREAQLDWLLHAVQA